ncbi:MAG: 3-deoxy-D-manno-octulosonic acid transferase [Alphaproteobacteria bacterium]|nr:3-deoxy-D-manno-octulosonic acid transferase [Alphaproteobacteria bacterium]
MDARGATAALYGALAGAAAPLARHWLRRRVAAGKEDPLRVAERTGIAITPRPPGALLWVHGASMGELRSVVPLIRLIAAARPDVNFLITSGTRTSAEMIAQAPPPRSIHQYVPLDIPAWIERFLDHWRPDAVLWLESELWPNLIRQTRQRGIAMALVNGRLSDRSFARWRRISRIAAPPVAAFAPCLAQSEADARRFEALGVPAVCVGNLKFDGTPAPADAAPLDALRAAIGARPVWLAASTHPGEEEIVARAHRAVRARHRDALLIVVPRHANRGTEIAERLAAQGHGFVRRSLGNLPAPEHDLYIADTMGELGMLYRLAMVAFIGKSIASIGGQNPIEPARLQVATVFGPHMENFRDVASALTAAGGAIQIRDESALAATIIRLLGDPDERARVAAAGFAVTVQGQGAAERALAALAPLLAALPRPAAERNHASA